MLAACGNESQNAADQLLKREMAVSCEAHLVGSLFAGVVVLDKEAGLLFRGLNGVSTRPGSLDGTVRVSNGVRGV